MARTKIQVIGGPGAKPRTIVVDPEATVGATLGSDVYLNGAVATPAAVRTWLGLSAAGSGAAFAANPTGTVGLTTTNGTSPSFMRSDAAPPLNQGITPVWTGAHQWNANVGFHGTTPIAKPTVSGSRADPEAALANLLTALANYGLITNSTTA